MAESTKAVPTEKEMDEFSISMFESIGYERGRFPKELVSKFFAYKRRKDIIQPSRLSPGEFALISLLSDDESAVDKKV